MSNLESLTDGLAIAICLQAVSEFQEIVGEDVEISLTPCNRKNVVSLVADNLVIDNEDLDKLKDVVEVYDATINLIETRR